MRKSYGDRNTFGVGHRLKLEKKPDGDAAYHTDPGYNVTLPRSPGAVILGRYGQDYGDDIPGPGQYNVRRDPSPTKGIRMCPNLGSPKKLEPGESLAPMQINSHSKSYITSTESTPGYYDTRGTLIKKSFCRGNFGAGVRTTQSYLIDFFTLLIDASFIQETCEHKNTHDYCCRNCCVLCNAKSKKIYVEDTAANRAKYLGSSRYHPTLLYTFKSAVMSYSSILIFLFYNDTITVELDPPQEGEKSRRCPLRLLVNGPLSTVLMACDNNY